MATPNSESEHGGPSVSRFCLRALEWPGEGPLSQPCSRLLGQLFRIINTRFRQLDDETSELTGSGVIRGEFEASDDSVICLRH
jgi:hypothetical protein